MSEKIKQWCTGANINPKDSFTIKDSSSFFSLYLKSTFFPHNVAAKTLISFCNLVAGCRVMCSTA
jgi:hypothetical protein